LTLCCGGIIPGQRLVRFHDWIERFTEVLLDYREHILEDDDGLLTLFQDARRARRQWIETRYKRD